jgi:hypothetical protein
VGSVGTKIFRRVDPSPLYAGALDDIGAALQLEAGNAEALANFGLPLHAAGRFAERLAAQENADGQARLQSRVE